MESDKRVSMMINQNVFKLMFFICLISIEFLATTTIEIKVVEGLWDKSNHFFAFFVLYVLLSLGFTRLGIKTKVYILLAFAVQIEVVQYFIEGRYFSTLDIVADSIGIAIGILILKLYSLLYSKYRTP